MERRSFLSKGLALGLTKAYDLGYRNHRMDNISIQELRGRLIFLFRLLKVDTIISYDPWRHYEENPDHYVTAKAVESARWMAGGQLELPRTFRCWCSAPMRSLNGTILPVARNW